MITLSNMKGYLAKLIDFAIGTISELTESQLIILEFFSEQYSSFDGLLWALNSPNLQKINVQLLDIYCLHSIKALRRVLLIQMNAVLANMWLYKVVI